MEQDVVPYTYMGIPYKYADMGCHTCGWANVHIWAE